MKSVSLLASFIGLKLKEDFVYYSGRFGLKLCAFLVLIAHYLNAVCELVFETITKNKCGIFSITEVEIVFLFYTDTFGKPCCV